ncbi:MAG: glycoside hydrolase family 13 protein [Anaerovoracaceae bacterium]|jgi:cyclomaltodextrinase
MKIKFNSRDETYKKPAGPLKSGDLLKLRIAVAGDEDISISEVSVVVEFDKNKSTASYRMDPAEEMSDEKGSVSCGEDGFRYYEAVFHIIDTGLYWYHFEIKAGDDVVKIGKSGPDNKAVVSSAPAPWQQTVYKRKYDVPEWLCGGVIYQIFIDRFCHEGGYVEMPGKKVRRDWGGMPQYRPDENGEILNNDFFGGNFRGIIEKLPYLEDLGVTCIYLSPICEAYSNHKYDTADYMKTDPMFGTEEEFTELCRKAGEHGIRIICDGVFSHTGSDSLYFDRYGHYGGNGAWKNPDSPYRQWYYFNEDESYETWWGIKTLPRINKNNPSYVNFICGQYGVARHWLKLGASGWRLDVADELPNSFLEKLVAAVKEEKPDAAVIGEVWEDASSKTSYGERKNYFEGDKLDSVMNYPFRTAVIDFVKNGDYFKISSTVETIIENYPPEVVCCLMNSLGTHDTERILTVLGGKDLGPEPLRETEAAEHLSEADYEKAVKRLMTAEVIQMTLPGVPCIYYGDEAGMQGYRDPFNRQCFPWGKEDRRLTAWTMMLTRFRRRHEVYKKGAYRTLVAEGGLYAFERYDENERIVTVANCGETTAVLDGCGSRCDAISGKEYKGKVEVAPCSAMLFVETTDKRTPADQIAEAAEIKSEERIPAHAGG